MIIEIIFLEPDRQHTPDREGRGGDISIPKLALILEKKYHLIQTFCEIKKREIIKILLSEIQRNKNFYIYTQEKIKNEWRDYIFNELHKIKPKAAEIAEREAFINTGDYYRNMTIKVEIKNG